MQKFSRFFTALSVFALTIAGAFSGQIEYSIRAETAPEIENAPTVATPQATPNIAPVAPNIDPNAMQLLQQTQNAYNNLKSFSANVKMRSSDAKYNSDSTIQWQKPNRLAILRHIDKGTSRIVSNGVTVWTRHSSKPNEYLKDKANTSENPQTLPLTLKATALDKYLPALGYTDELGKFDSSEYVQSVILAPSSSSSQSYDTVVKISASPYGEQTLYFRIDKRTHLLHSVEGKSIYKADATHASESFHYLEEYSNVRINPALPASTFAFTVRPTDKLIVVKKPAEPVRFDARLKRGAAPLPFSAKDLDGKTISPATFKGRVVLLDFWATWCPPCIAEIPNVKANYDKYHAQGFDVVGISFDKDRAALDTFLAKHEIAWPQIFEGNGWKNKVGEIYGVQSIPFTVLIGRDGKIVDVDLRGPELETALKTALAKK